MVFYILKTKKPSSVFKRVDPQGVIKLHPPQTHGRDPSQLWEVALGHLFTHCSLSFVWLAKPYIMPRFPWSGNTISLCLSKIQKRWAAPSSSFPTSEETEDRKGLTHSVTSKNKFPAPELPLGSGTASLSLLLLLRSHLTF